jgi:hypothetical protein
MLSLTDQIVLDTFRRYLVTPGEMLCFHGQWLDDHKDSLRHLTARKLITKEQFSGGYSLTRAGFAVIQKADKMATATNV